MKKYAQNFVHFYVFFTKNLCKFCAFFPKILNLRTIRIYVKNVCKKFLQKFCVLRTCTKNVQIVHKNAHFLYTFWVKFGPREFPGTFSAFYLELEIFLTKKCSFLSHFVYFFDPNFRRVKFV